MANTRRIGTIAIAVVMATSIGEAQGNDGRPAVTVHVENHADLKPSILYQAANQLAHVYDAAGVRVVWSTRPDHTEDSAGTLTIHVLVMSLGMEGRLVRSSGVGSKVLGQANRGARRVHIFWSRVDAHVSRTSSDVGDALGFVIAHELGHVMLPPNSHSPTGIMQENYLVHASYGTRFTAEQSAAIRTLITGSSTPGQPGITQ